MLLSQSLNFQHLKISLAQKGREVKVLKEAENLVIKALERDLNQEDHQEKELQEEEIFHQMRN